ncbi:hypothetical protein LQW54_009882 [Pestalotiopsis sp. IQ-011]
MTKYTVLRDHSNAEPLVKAWDAAGEDASFAELLLSTFPPRPWLSSEASRKRIEDRLSNVTLNSSASGQGNWRNTRKRLDDAAEYGKSSGWDAGAEPYTGPLPTYEDVEALRIMGAKLTGCGTLPKRIEKAIKEANVGFLLEDPSDRKTPIHPFWASRVAAEYPATEKTTEDGTQETPNQNSPVFAHLHAAGTMPTTDDDHEHLDDHNEHDDDGGEFPGDVTASHPVSQGVTTRSAAKKTQQELQREESEDESPRSPVSSQDNGWEEVTGPPQDNEEEEEEEEEEDDGDGDEDGQDDGSVVADPRPEHSTTISQTLITSHAFIGMLTDALSDTGLPITTTTAVRKAVNADSGALRGAMAKVLERATDIWLAEYKKPIFEAIGGEAAETGDRGRNKKRRRTSSSLGAQRRD